jgi:cytochrome c
MMRRTIMLVLMLAVAALTLGACGGTGGGGAAPADIPRTISAQGDPAQGKLVFENQGGCIACHRTDTQLLVGPGLAGVVSPAGPVRPAGVDYGSALPNGQPRTEENLAAWIRQGGQGKIGVKTPHALNDADMADVLAYLRTLTR